jgi:hypothetical protein
LDNPYKTRVLPVITKIIKAGKWKVASNYVNIRPVKSGRRIADNKILGRTTI